MNNSSSIQDAGVKPLLSPQADEIEIVYSHRGVRRNGRAGCRMMIEDLARSGRLIWLLVLRDISVRYRQSILGYLWAIVPQIVTVGAFAVLNSWRVIPMGKTAVPYVLYAAWGVSVWQLFAGCLSACTSSLAAGGSLVTKMNFPRESLVVAALGQPIFDFLVRLIPVMVVFAWHGFTPSAAIIFVPLALCPVLFLALGLGFILSIANLAVKDVGNALGTALTIGMFLTPVLYPPPVRWPFRLINTLNPVSPLLAATQELLAIGSLTRPDLFAAGCLFSVIVLIVGWRIFRVTILRAAGYA
jgi:lipopolysaccharide transport system permease protein